MQYGEATPKSSAGAGSKVNDLEVCENAVFAVFLQFKAHMKMNTGDGICT